MPKFQPGKTGNAGGRKKLTVAQAEALRMRRNLQPEIVTRLAGIIRDGQDCDAIAAARILLEELPKELNVNTLVTIRPQWLDRIERNEVFAIARGDLKALPDGH